MTDQTSHPAAADEPAQPDAVHRRMLLRGGAVLAGAAGVAAIGTIAPTRAAAVNGDTLKMGQLNSATSSTQVQMTGPANQPALVLQKSPGGPHLQMNPANNVPQLARGGLQFTSDGPVVGVTDGTTNGVENDYVVLGIDLDQIAVPTAQKPRRLVDTRSKASRESLLDISANAFDSAGRLRAGAWIDISVGGVSEDAVEAVFLNVTVTGSTKGGYVTACPSGPKPPTSTLNFSKGQTIANGAFIGTALSDGSSYCVRIYASAPTHVIVDLTGKTLLGARGVSTVPEINGVPPARRSAARRVVRVRRHRAS